MKPTHLRAPHQLCICIASLAFVLSPPSAFSQDAPQNVAPQVTEKAAQAVPTNGGFVDHGPIVFEDATQKSGLSKFVHVSGSPAKDYIIEGSNSGVALLDYDNDGWLDIYLVNGSTIEAQQGKAKAPHAMLLHNNHDGTFTDVTEKAGVANDRWGIGVAVGDYDNDGWPDLYVSNFGKSRLYHNNHDGTFTDVAEKAGVAVDAWSTGVTFGDYDGDGKLDLFVAGYVQFDVNHLPAHGSEAVNYSFCEFRGKPVMCGPRGLKGERDHLFHNNGDGTFTDVSEKAGVADKSGYYGFSAAFVDLNNDGKLDLVVANDSTPNYLYLNKGDGTFEDASYASGFAVNGSGREQASMGLAIGDYRNDGNLDLYVTTFSDDYNTMFLNDGKANFTDVSADLGIADITVPFLGWGTGFLDFDNDGWKDLFVANGHLYPEVEKNPWGTTYQQRPLLFRNLQGKSFELVPAVRGSGLAQDLTARGVAVGDLFNNGKIDIVINQAEGHPVLLRNVSQDQNHWLGVRLIGSGSKSPKDATGAKVYVTASGIRQRADIISGGNFLSNNDSRLHFGLGSAKTIDKLEIEWPSGGKETIPPPAVDRYVVIEEGKGVLKGKKW